jgi:isoleucyl-tRNA synthetase
VHLSSFPVSNPDLINQSLGEQVALSRRLVELGRAARAESKIKIRQPLGRALVSAPGFVTMDQEIRDQITDELNVLALDDLSTQGQDLVNVSIKANFRNIGARYGSDVQAIAAAIASISGSDAAEFVKSVRTAGATGFELGYENKVATITVDDLVITETPKEGWSVASHSGESLALDLALTPDLIQAGLMREVIRTIQEERKNANFDISDRIHVRWFAGADVSAAIARYRSEIATEVLALSITQSDDLTSATNEIGLSLSLTKA